MNGVALLILLSRLPVLLGWADGAWSTRGVAAPAQTQTEPAPVAADAVADTRRQVHSLSRQALQPLLPVVDAARGRMQTRLAPGCRPQQPASMTRCCARV